jgi:polar amino acid transport system permease protein
VDVGIHQRSRNRCVVPQHLLASVSANVNSRSDGPPSGAGANPPASLGRRARYVRRQKRQSTSVALLSTLIVISILVGTIPRFSGWQSVRESFFSAKSFKNAIPKLWSPFLLNLRIFIICAPLIVVVGVLVAVARNVRSPLLFPLRLFATLYTDVVRGVPVILWITLIGFGVPGLFSQRAWYTKPVIWGGFALVFCYGAYVAEVFRAGIEGIHESQRAAARSLGLSSRQTMTGIVLPQAIRRVIPPLMNDLVSLQKDVALISIIGPVEALRRANNLVQREFNFTPLVAAAVLFLLVSIPLTRLTDYLLARERRRTGGTVVS